MDKLRIRWIIGFMTTALLGLVAFQGYWLNSLVTANEDEFKRNVSSALREVSLKLEQLEALRIVKEQARQQALIQQIRNQGPVIIDQGNGNPVVVRWGDTLSNDEQGIQFSYVMEASGGQVQVYSDQPVSIQTDNHTDTEHDINVEDHERQIHEEQMMMQQAVERMSKNSETMLAIMEELMIPKPLMSNRLDENVVDSLLESELSNRGIQLPYNYGVLQPQMNRFVALSDVGEQQTLLNSEYQVALFPNDMMGQVSYLLVDFPGQSKYLQRKILLTMSSSGVLMLIILAVFAYAIQTILRQKKLSEMKTDFINNMTHELKTPIATIGLAVEALQDRAIQQENAMRERYLGVIGEENKRLGTQVERVLQMARIDRDEITLQKEKTDIHELINSALEKISLQVENRSGDLKTALNAGRSIVLGDETHLLNVLLNLLENALKYSPDRPVIMVRTESFRSHIQIYVKDRGVGMRKEAIKHIFEKFYRVPTGDVHDVKGYGLGLPYVKNMIEAHGGTISVESEVGKGSNFIIKLPLRDE